MNYDLFRSKKTILLLVGAISALIYPILFSKPYNVHVGIMTLMFIMVAQAWNIIGGYAGQWALGNAVYFGIGAYTSSILFRDYHLTPWVGMIIGGLFAVGFAIIVSYPTFRLSRYYFAIATLTINETMRYFFSYFEWSGGSKGFFLKPDYSTINFMWKSNMPYYYVMLSFAAITFLICYFIDRSKAGIYFKAINKDEAAALNLGVDTPKYKLLAMTIAAFLTAIAGSFYVQYVFVITPGFVMPYDFNIRIITLTLMGGWGTVAGPIIGGLIMIPLGEYFRIFFQGIGRSGGAFNLIVYGLMTIIIASFAPNGIVGYIRKRRKSKGSRS